MGLVWPGMAGGILDGSTAAAQRANLLVGVYFAVCAAVVAVLPLVRMLPITMLLLVIAGWDGPRA